MPKISLKAHFEPLVARFGGAQSRLTSGRAVSAAWQRGRGRTVLPVSDLYGQGSYLVRLDWGAVGAQACLADVCVVVDVLSFSTSVTIAVERGMQVLPFPWKDARAADFAWANDAVLAVGRLEATKDGAVPAPSLSPAGLLACDPVPPGSCCHRPMARPSPPRCVRWVRRYSLAAFGTRQRLEDTSPSRPLVATRWRSWPPVSDGGATIRCDRL